jgi:CRISPR-associated exonuclease Cas4
MNIGLLTSIGSALRFGINTMGVWLQACIRWLRCICSSIGTGPYEAFHSPHPLAGSELLFAEQSFAIRRPLKLAVRVDRVYDDGSKLILLELKTRSTTKVYLTDIIELSAQRLALRHSTERPVSDYAFLLQKHPLLQKQSLRRIELLSEQEILSLSARRTRLMAGLIEPERQVDQRKCARCEYRVECKSERQNPVAPNHGA